MTGRSHRPRHRLRGAGADVIRTALEEGDPFPGTTGFAGQVDDALVRDVLGRVPLFLEGDRDRFGPSDSSSSGEFEDTERTWAFSPTELEDPVPLEPGVTLEATGARTAWHLPDPDPVDDPERALESLETAIETAAADAPSEDVAVAFSGGVDSALVAALLDAPLYVVGFPGSHDVEAARSAAQAMGREADLTVIDLEPTDLERAVPEVVRAIGRTNAMDVQIALPLSLVGERVAADGFESLALGQGADELFGGYEKVVHLDHRVASDTVRGAVRESIQTLPEQLPRDVLALEAAGVEPVTPFLHDAVVQAALRLPTELLATEGERKIALRRVSREYLPAAVVDRPKKAVQYGSLVSRELDRLARQAGYKRRMDDHVTKYVESRLE